MVEAVKYAMNICDLIAFHLYITMLFESFSPSHRLCVSSRKKTFSPCVNLVLVLLNESNVLILAE